MIKTLALAAITSLSCAANLEQRALTKAASSTKPKTPTKTKSKGLTIRQTSKLFEAGLKVLTNKVNQIDGKQRDKYKDLNKNVGLINVIGARASGQISTNLDLAEDLKQVQSAVTLLSKRVSDTPTHGSTSEKYTNFKASVDNLYYRQNFYLEGIIRLENLTKIMQYQEHLHEKLDYLVKAKDHIDNLKDEIVDYTVKLETSLDSEPHNSWNSLWLDQKQTVDDSLADPAGASYFAAIPLMAFGANEGTIDSFCLEEGQYFEFFLNLDTVSTNGNDVFAVSLSTSNSMDGALVVDRKHSSRQANNFSFHLFYRGRVEPGMNQLNIVYNAQAKRFQNPISMDNGFFWGYRILSELEGQQVVDKHKPCCEIRSLCDLPQH